MSGPNNPLEEFRRVTGATMRAIAERNDLQATFSTGPANLLGSEARLPLPARHLPAGEVAYARGEADAIALKVRHHDAKLHARECPKTPLAREVFNAVDTFGATVVAFAVGLLVIAFFMRYISRRSFLPFVVYRIALGVLLMILLATGVMHA